ncbi:hypothetical protein I5Q82_02360 [Acutalibacter muris]|jgi:hypothetical protein|uniref:Uncharacterized protein n=1 Tax=Acutalibacter muris TaxID=1796620 RepID=A0A1Z2XSD2_9FIRM|nr:hypothetical protein [Acutalibacter muris]ANU55439.1 hypothetical protein A4V00_16270 [Hungateiclostridiaceae bacterium KB18]ASB41325.1 hypothetical protein ADH66_12050 [Acutalibacter muris]QQR30591.1 hypothetical protein I5Q82_02360 [Acutalibacter muris]
MRHFEYFLFENFDPDQTAAHPGNPRQILRTQADGILSRVADFPPGACPAGLLHEEFGSEAVDRLISAGALRNNGERIYFDTPVFLAEDAPALQRFSRKTSIPLADLLCKQREKLWETAETVCNGFPPSVNLLDSVAIFGSRDIIMAGRQIGI